MAGVTRAIGAPRMSPFQARILLADDDHDLREALELVLRKRGYDVQAVASGIGLVDRLSGALLDGAESPVDAIITDVRMPGCNGLNVVEGLRANGLDLPIIVISAFGDEDMRARIARMRNVHLMEKPFRDPELAHLLESVLPTRASNAVSDL